MKGLLIAIEGFDGSGKTTLSAKLETALTDAGYEVVLVRQPGGTPLAEELRSLLKANTGEPISEDVEFLLMTAARRQLIDTVIMPAIDEGKIVITDRHIFSTMAYQNKTYEDVTQFIPELPTFNVFMKTSYEECRRRAGQRDEECRIELKEEASKLKTFSRYAELIAQNAPAPNSYIYEADSTIDKLTAYIDAFIKNGLGFNITDLETVMRTYLGLRLIVKADAATTLSKPFIINDIPKLADLDAASAFVSNVIRNTPFTITNLRG